MNFFAQQDLARRNTRLLVMLFALAVIGLIFLTNGLVAAFLWFSEDYNLYAGSRGGLQGYLQQFSVQRFGSIGLLVIATVLLVSLVKWVQLARGGKVIAEGLGARRILPQTRDADERRCLNVVQEIALAASMPVPAVYLLPDERGINAFAAGVTPADAVITVTSGTLHHLRRNELQGVIGHEFSHILNGDMRLNIRLAALLKGITFIGDVGYFLLHSGTRMRGTGRRDRNSGAALPLLGVGLLVVGWLGAMSAGLIKAAISRQKEFLADAASVQFTRDPHGISDALKVIGGYLPGTLVHSARAPEMAHMFFGEVTHSIWQTYATHPPLPARIRRIEPGWDGKFIEREVRHYTNPTVNPQSIETGVGRAALVAAAIAAGAGLSTDSDYSPAEEIAAAPADKAAELPADLLRIASEALGAGAITFAFLVADEPALRAKQLAMVARHEIPGQAVLVNTLTDQIHALPPGQRLPMLNACFPALRTMSLPQYREFKNTLLQLIQADKRTELLEWCLFQTARHYLDPEFIEVKHSKPRYSRFEKVDFHLRVVLSVLAHEGSGDAREAFRAAADYLDFPQLEPLPLDQCPVSTFSRSVHELANLYPLLKPRFLKAMALAAGADGDFCAVERELITSIAAVMDCPLPEQLAAELFGAVAPTPK